MNYESKEKRFITHFQNMRYPTYIIIVHIRRGLFSILLYHNSKNLFKLSIAQTICRVTTLQLNSTLGNVHHDLLRLGNGTIRYVQQHTTTNRIIRHE